MTDHSYETGVTDDSHITVDPPYLDYFRSHGYKVRGVQDVRFVESDSRDMDHMVCRIQTHALPWGHADLDVSSDAVTIPVCSCEDYQYNQSVDVAEYTLRERSPGLCRHLRSEYKSLRAEADENQSTL